MNPRRIEVLVFDGCPNVDVAIDRDEAASKDTDVPANVTVVRVENKDEALRLLPGQAGRTRVTDSPFTDRSSLAPRPALPSRPPAR
jgi:hypothetical protein